MSIPSLVNKHIFILEDNVSNLAIERIILEQGGARVTSDRWGQNTLNLLIKARPVDLILLDLMLPGNITGYDVFAQIRQTPQFERVPIVAVSASDPTESIARTQASGFAGFIAKPIHFNHFPLQIADILQGKPVWDYGNRLPTKKDRPTNV